MPVHKVVIIGAGFAGLNAAKNLGDKKDLEVTLIDKRNYHLFQPLLYQVATAGLSPAEIATPIRSILCEYKNIRIVLDEIKDINLNKKEICSSQFSYPYDSLIVAGGASHSYFGNETWEEWAPGLKTVEQATEIRRRILTAFEEAEKIDDVDLQRAFLTFVIIGAGPTGVELAGSIAELSKVTLAKDFRKIEPSRARVILVEAGERVLPGFHEKLSRVTLRNLERIGVQVWTKTRVTSVNQEGIQAGHDFISSRTVIWAAGVKTNSLANCFKEVEKDRLGRLRVKKDLSLETDENVYVIGDMCSFQNSDGSLLPGLAPVAIQQGRRVALNILRNLKGLDREDFKYKDKGMMATIGRNKAVAQAWKFLFWGTFAWFMWLFIHVFYLIGFKNRLFVLAQWSWSYFTYSRGARLIVWKDWRS